MSRWQRILGALIALTVVGSGSISPAHAQLESKRVFAWVESLSGTQDDPLGWPLAVASKTADEFAVLDAQGPRLVVFRRTGVSWQTVHIASLTSGPSGLAYDQGAYVVALRADRVLMAFDDETWSERRLEIPGGVVPGPIAAVPGGGLLLHDLAGNRVFHLDSNGRTVRQTGIGERASALVAKRSGGFLASVAEKGIILSFNANWQLEGTWTLPFAGQIPAWPVGINQNPGGEFLVIDRHSGRILVLDAAGKLIGIGSGHGFDSGLLHFPAGATRLPDGLLVVADQGNGRVQLFRRLDRSFSK